MGAEPDQGVSLFLVFGVVMIGFIVVVARVREQHRRKDQDGDGDG